MFNSHPEFNNWPSNWTDSSLTQRKLIRVSAAQITSEGRLWRGTRPQTEQDPSLYARNKLLRPVEWCWCVYTASHCCSLPIGFTVAANVNNFFNRWTVNDDDSSATLTFWGLSQAQSLFTCKGNQTVCKAADTLASAPLKHLEMSCVKRLVLRNCKEKDACDQYQV